MPVLIKKNSSRLAHATLYVLDGIEFWSRPIYPELPSSANDVPHTVEDDERIEMIAEKYYGNQEWWWIIAYRNNLGLFPVALIPGQTLVIPDPAVVRGKMFK